MGLLEREGSAEVDAKSGDGLAYLGAKVRERCGGDKGSRSDRSTSADFTRGGRVQLPQHERKREAS